MMLSDTLVLLYYLLYLLSKGYFIIFHVSHFVFSFHLSSSISFDTYIFIVCVLTMFECTVSDFEKVTKKVFLDVVSIHYFVCLLHNMTIILFFAFMLTSGPLTHEVPFPINNLLFSFSQNPTTKYRKSKEEQKVVS